MDRNSRAFPEITFEDARPEDLLKIVEIYNATIPGRMATADDKPVTVESRRPWFENHAPEKRPLWVARKNKEVVAWISFQSFYGRPAYDGTAEISVYVSRDYQGRGLGKNLVGQAIERAPKLQIKNLLAFVFSHNVSSITLFNGLGFQKWGELPGVAVLDGVERDLFILGFKIRTTASSPRGAGHSV